MNILINEDSLIVLVQQNDFLYNKTNKEYKNTKKKEVWEAIGRELGASESVVRTFVQDGVITEYATHVAFGTPDNVRIYSQDSRKTPTVLNASVNPFGQRELMDVIKTASEIVFERINHMQSCWPISATGRAQQSENNILNRFSTNMKSRTVLKNKSVSKLSTDACRNFENQMFTSHPAIGLRSVKNDFFLNKKTKIGPLQLNPYTVKTRQLSTVTYYGFSEFTTVVGKSVLIFSPNTIHSHFSFLDSDLHQNEYTTSTISTDKLVAKKNDANLSQAFSNTYQVHHAQNNISTDVFPNGTTDKEVETNHKINIQNLKPEFREYNTNLSWSKDTRNTMNDDSPYFYKVYNDSTAIHNKNSETTKLTESAIRRTTQNLTVANLIKPSRTSFQTRSSLKHISNESSFVYSGLTSYSSIEDFLNIRKLGQSKIRELGYIDINKIENCKLTSDMSVTQLPVLFISAFNKSNVETKANFFCIQSQIFNQTQIVGRNNYNHLHAGDLFKKNADKLDSVTYYKKKATKKESTSNLKKNGISYVNNDIQLIYKTLYTVYTYLTTYFNNESSSFLSQTEMESNILISEYKMSPANYDIYMHNSKSEREDENWKSQPFISLESKIANCQSDCLTFDINIPKQQSGLSTTYTFYTTIFSNTNSRVILNRVVVDRCLNNTEVSESSENKIGFYINGSNQKQFSTQSVASNMSTRLHMLLLRADDKNHNLQPQHTNKQYYDVPIMGGSRNSKQIHGKPGGDPLHKDFSSYLFNSNYATILLQTGFTTHTYFTTIYSKEKTDVSSHLETVTTTMTETYHFSPTNTNVFSVQPITYYTTFTFWTKLVTNNQITTTSREETISNIITPSNVLLAMDVSTKRQDLRDRHSTVVFNSITACGASCIVGTYNIIGSEEHSRTIYPEQMVYADFKQDQTITDVFNSENNLQGTIISNSANPSNNNLGADNNPLNQSLIIDLDIGHLMPNNGYFVNTERGSFSNPENKFKQKDINNLKKDFNNKINSSKNILQRKELHSRPQFLKRSLNDTLIKNISLENGRDNGVENHIHTPFQAKTKIFTSQKLPFIGLGRSHQNIQQNDKISASKITRDNTIFDSWSTLNIIDSKLSQALPPIHLEGTMINFHLSSSSLFGSLVYEEGKTYLSPTLIIDTDATLINLYGEPNKQKKLNVNSVLQNYYGKMQINNQNNTLQVPPTMPQETVKRRNIATRINTKSMFSLSEHLLLPHFRSMPSPDAFEKRVSKKITQCFESNANKCQSFAIFNVRPKRAISKPYNFSTKTPELKSRNARDIKVARSRFRKRRPNAEPQDDNNSSVEGKIAMRKKQPEQTHRYRTRSDVGSRYSDNTTNTFIGSNKRLIRPSHSLITSSTRAKFTLREKELTTSMTQKNVIPVKRIPLRKHQAVNGSGGKRFPATSATQSFVGKRRLSSNTNIEAMSSISRNLAAHRNRPATVGRSRTGSFRESEVRTRHRISHEDVNDANIFSNSGTITVTRVIPVDTYLPVVNDKSTELKHIVTARTSTEILFPQQYTKTLSANGQIYLALTSESSSINSNGATEIVRYILHEYPTTTITFTPTSIRGRKTSFSLILPSTAYSVENVVSTLQPQIQADTPLANILLSQLLLGNVAFPSNILYGLYNGPPSQTAVDYITHTSTYVTTVFEGKSTILPITFQGKKILTTIYDTTAQTITATEFITDTIVTTPTTTSNIPIVNSLLLQQLLFKHVTEPVKDIDINSNEMPMPIKQRKELTPEHRVQDSGEQNYILTNVNEDLGLTEPFTERTKSRRSGKKHKRKHKDDTVTGDVSIITLFVSGRRPGEFSTVLSTVQTTPTINKRNVQNKHTQYNSYT